MTVAEKVRVLMRRRGMSVTTLAEATGQTRQNLSNKLSRDNFTMREAENMAKALGYTMTVTFTSEDGADTL